MKTGTSKRRLDFPLYFFRKVCYSIEKGKRLERTEHGGKESKNLLDLSIKVIDDLEFSSKEKSERFKDNKLYLIDDYLRQDKNSKKLNKSI